MSISQNESFQQRRDILGPLVGKEGRPHQQLEQGALWLRHGGFQSQQKAFSVLSLLTTAPEITLAVIKMDVPPEVMLVIS